MEHPKEAELSNQVHSRALANHVHGQKKVELKYWVETVTGTSGYDAFFSCYGGAWPPLPQEGAGMCGSSNFGAFATIGRKWSLSHHHCYFSFLTNWVDAKFIATLFFSFCMSALTSLCFSPTQSLLCPLRAILCCFESYSCSAWGSTGILVTPKISSHLQRVHLLLTSAASWCPDPSHAVLAGYHQDPDPVSTHKTSKISLYWSWEEDSVLVV